MNTSNNYTPAREAVCGLIVRVQEIKQNFDDSLMQNADTEAFMDSPEYDIVALAIEDTLTALVWAHGALMRREFLDACPAEITEIQRRLRAEYIKNMTEE